MFELPSCLFMTIRVLHYLHYLAFKESVRRYASIGFMFPSARVLSGISRGIIRCSTYCLMKIKKSNPISRRSSKLFEQAPPAHRQYYTRPMARCSGTGCWRRCVVGLAVCYNSQPSLVVVECSEVCVLVEWCVGSDLWVEWCVGSDLWVV